MIIYTNTCVNTLFSCLCPGNYQPTKTMSSLRTMGTTATPGVMRCVATFNEAGDGDTLKTYF